MSAAVRWLAIVVLGWTGARAGTLGLIPGSDMFTLGVPPARGVTPRPTHFPALEPAVPLYSAASWPERAREFPVPPAGWTSQPTVMPYPVPHYRYAPAAVQRYDFTPSTRLYSPVPSIEDWPAVEAASVRLPASTPISRAVAAPPKPKFDRIQLTAWALLRGGESLGLQPRSLASGGALGGRQAGARLMYRFSPELAASLRTTSAVGTSQSEVAAGIRLTPIRSFPLSFTAERRQAIGRYGGRSAFALFAESGIYGQSLAGFDIDGYAQAGVVGIRDRALFVDGAMAFTRPVYRQFSGGFGIWGGIQPGVYRIDAGPRVSYRVRPNVRVHFDWRQRLGGRALPQSGPAVTLAGDF